MDEGDAMAGAFELTALREENANLRLALAPFVEMAKCHDVVSPDDYELVPKAIRKRRRKPDALFPVLATVSDLYRAHHAVVGEFPRGVRGRLLRPGLGKAGGASDVLRVMLESALENERV